MKKITLLYILLIFPVLCFGQTWDFTNSDDGWKNVATTKTSMADYWELTSKNGVNNPGLKIAPPVPAVDVTTVNILAITMKNLSATGPAEIRAIASTSGDPDSGSKNISIPISNGDTEYQTYYIDFSGNKWVGTVDEIKILFKAAGNTDFVGTGAEVFNIDKIEMLATIPTTLKESYTFDTDDDNEGFSTVNGTITGPASGLLTFEPTPAKFAKLEQLLHHVNADNNKYVRVTLKNNSTANNQLRFVYSKADGSGNVTKTTEISVNDTSEQLYGFDLSSDTDWSGDKPFTIGIGSTTDGKAADNGTVEISSIVFNNTVLSVERNGLADFLLYPNPVNDKLYFNSPTSISKIEIYNLTGQRLKNFNKFNTNSVDFSTLNNGVYLLNVTDIENNSTTKKIIVQK